MWQDNLALEAFANHGCALVVVNSQRHDVCDHPGNSAGMEAAHGQDTSKNGILVSIWEVSAADNQTRKEELRVRAILTRIG